MLTAADLLTRHGIKLERIAPGRHYTTCPRCSATRKLANQNRKTLGVTINGDGAHWGCNHCGWTGPEKGSGNGRGGDNLITYDYQDDSGVVQFQKVRAYDKDGKKFFWLRRPDGHGGWIKGTKGVDTSLIYRKPEVIEAMALDRIILVVEGEKDCDRLWSWASRQRATRTVRPMSSRTRIPRRSGRQNIASNCAALISSSCPTTTRQAATMPTPRQACRTASPSGSACSISPSTGPRFRTAAMSRIISTPGTAANNSTR